MSESSQSITRNGELLPCPFCGGKARIFELTWTDGLGVPHDFKHPYYRIVCQGGCRTLKGDYNTEAEAIAAWNTRAERTCEMEYSGGVPDFVSLDTWTCTECGSPIYNDCEPSYCEYCGAKVVSE